MTAGNKLLLKSRSESGVIYFEAISSLHVSRLVKESLAAKDSARTSLIIAQLNDLARSQHANSRSGGIMGLAGCS